MEEDQQHHHQQRRQQRLTSESPPQLPPRAKGRLLLPPSGKTVQHYKGDDLSEDSNSDTGLSSLNSSSEADQFTLDTLV